MVFLLVEKFEANNFGSESRFNLRIKMTFDALNLRKGSPSNALEFEEGVLAIFSWFRLQHFRKPVRVQHTKLKVALWILIGTAHALLLRAIEFYQRKQEKP